jgi:hypothetical protein
LPGGVIALFQSLSPMGINGDHDGYEVQGLKESG